jgi:hypothetical protein
MNACSQHRDSRFCDALLTLAISTRGLSNRSVTDQLAKPIPTKENRSWHNASVSREDDPGHTTQKGVERNDV